MTQQQELRIRKCIVETHLELDRELRYSVDLQKKDRIEYLRSHLAKLQELISK